MQSKSKVRAILHTHNKIFSKLVCSLKELRIGKVNLNTGSLSEVTTLTLGAQGNRMDR